MKIGLGSLLFVVFLTLKLTHNIDWSWFWVTAPLWIPLAIFLTVAFFVVMFVGAVAVLSELLK